MSVLLEDHDPDLSLSTIHSLGWDVVFGVCNTQVEQQGSRSLRLRRFDDAKDVRRFIDSIAFGIRDLIDDPLRFERLDRVVNGLP